MVVNFVFNVFINSLLMFFTTWLLIECLLFIFRIKPGRFASYFRMIPLIKLPFDPFLYDFSSWSYLHGINPLLCEKGSRTLTVGHTGIAFFQPGSLTFTVADVMQSLSPSWLTTSIVYFVLGSMIFAALKFVWQRKELRSFLQDIEKNAKLRGRLIFTKDTSPFVSNQKIYMPSNLFTAKERHAVIEHEKEHLKYKDAQLKQMLLCIRSIFWWIPSKKLIDLIERGVEISCDAKAKNPLDLASAIMKTAKHAHLPLPGLCKQATKKRISYLIKGKRFSSIWICIPLGIFFTYFILFGRFWIF